MIRNSLYCVWAVFSSILIVALGIKSPDELREMYLPRETPEQ